MNGRYEQQMELQLNKTNEATPEETKQWIEEQNERYGKHQLQFIALMSLLQICSVGMMLLCFWLIGYAVK
tara:strand:- start:3834 stop:4043 length:210 start_codon:yes stop_codon:yes gene_type:complete